MINGEPEYRVDRIPQLITVMDMTIEKEYRYARLLEWVHALLVHGVPGEIVADLMSSMHWSVQNSIIGYNIKQDEIKTGDNQNV